MTSRGETRLRSNFRCLNRGRESVWLVNVKGFLYVSEESLVCRRVVLMVSLVSVPILDSEFSDTEVPVPTLFCRSFRRGYTKGVTVYRFRSKLRFYKFDSFQVKRSGDFYSVHLNPLRL